MLDTTPDSAGPRSLAMEIAEVHRQRSRLVQQFIRAADDQERDRVRCELSLKAAELHDLEQQHKAQASRSPAWERR
jgi:hypothetical protein